MSITEIPETEAWLSQLIDQVLNGEEIVIARAGTPVVRLVPIAAENSPRVGGQWRGRVRIAEEFDILPDDIADAFGITP